VLKVFLAAWKHVWILLWGRFEQVGALDHFKTLIDVLGIFLYLVH